MFNGKELDEETGLYYYGARYYSPRENVWASVDALATYDPIMNEEHYIDGEHNGGVYNSGNNNPYTYCYQNPVNLIDPNGKQTVSDVIHGGLDFIGLVPAFGEVADGINALYYLAEGNYTDAGLSATSMIPLAGYGATAVKAARYADKANDANKMKKLKESAEVGQEAHRQTQKGLKEKGAQIEVPMKLNDGNKVRKDAVKPDGTAVIIKPNNTSGQKSAKTRENLMQKNGHKTETILYDPKNPAYQKGSPTYKGPKKKN